jgi:hypothetical protein
MNLNAQGRDVLLLELPGKMSLDEGGLDSSLVCAHHNLLLEMDPDLSGATIANKHQLECWDALAFCSHVVDADR